MMIRHKDPKKTSTTLCFKVSQGVFFICLNFTSFQLCCFSNRFYFFPSFHLLLFLHLLASCFLSSLQFCVFIYLCVSHIASLLIILCFLFSSLVCVCVCVCVYVCQIDRTYNKRCVEMLAP